MKNRFRLAPRNHLTKTYLKLVKSSGLLFVIIALLSGCANTSSVLTATKISTSQPASTITATRTETQLPTEIPILTSTATATPVFVNQPCSPLEGIRLAELPQLMTGDVFNPPAPGRDDGHHGVDFAFYRHGNLTTMEGLPVQAILDGRVAAVIDNLKPYGNAIIIETPLETLSQQWNTTINLPALAPTVLPDPRLTCPVEPEQPWMASSQRSLYHLYAHLKEMPVVNVDESVTCGQVIGEVGTTGNSINPHLHLETRIGPAGATFSGLGHYDPRLSNEDRSNYCTWRVSNWFQMFDPMKILAQHP